MAYEQPRVREIEFVNIDLGLFHIQITNKIKQKFSKEVNKGEE